MLSNRREQQWPRPALPIYPRTQAPRSKSSNYVKLGPRSTDVAVATIFCERCHTSPLDFGAQL